MSIRPERINIATQTSQSSVNFSPGAPGIITGSGQSATVIYSGTTNIVTPLLEPPRSVVIRE